MRGKSLALLVLALGCGLVASLGITQVMAKRGGDQTAAPADLQSVYIAVKDIPVGVALNNDILKTEDWPKDKVPAGAIFRSEDVLGRFARAKFYAGEPILEQKLFGKGMSDLGTDRLIPKGMRVVSVKVDPTAIHGGLLMPGSRVDLQVMLRADPSNGIAQTATRTVLQGIKVFAVNDVVSLDSTGPQETKSIPGRTVSLLVTPDQAEKVTLAGELGMIRLIMRSPDDDEPVHSRGAVPQELFGTDSAKRTDENLVPQSATPADNGFAKWLSAVRAKMAAVKAPQPTSETPPTPDHWSMRVLRGSEVNDVEFEEGTATDAAKSADWRPVGGPLAPVASRTQPAAPETKRPTPPREVKPDTDDSKPKGDGVKPEGAPPAASGARQPS
jgi:pilus assembly protein CpaB